MVTTRCVDVDDENNNIGISGFKVECACCGVDLVNGDNIVAGPDETGIADVDIDDLSDVVFDKDDGKKFVRIETFGFDVKVGVEVFKVLRPDEMTVDNKSVEFTCSDGRVGPLFNTEVLVVTDKVELWFCTGTVNAVAPFVEVETVCTGCVRFTDAIVGASELDFIELGLEVIDSKFVGNACVVLAN